MTWLRQVATYSYQWPLKAVMNQQTQVNKIWEYREPPAAIGKHEVLWAPLLRYKWNQRISWSHRYPISHKYVDDFKKSKQTTYVISSIKDINTYTRFQWLRTCRTPKSKRPMSWANIPLLAWFYQSYVITPICRKTREDMLFSNKLCLDQRNPANTGNTTLAIWRRVGTEWHDIGHFHEQMHWTYPKSWCAVFWK